MFSVLVASLLPYLSLSVQHLKPSKKAVLQTFAEYKRVYGKEYSSTEELKIRYKKFAKRYKEVMTHNNEYHQHPIYYQELNRFSDMDDSELDHHLGLGNITQLVEIQRRRVANIKKRVAPPDSVDHGKHVTPVKNQLECSSCWAFAAVGSFESAYSMTTGFLKSFSEQELLDCTYKDISDNVCKRGGLTNDAFDHLELTQRLTTYTERPYASQVLACSSNTENGMKNLRFTGHQSVLVDDFVTAASTRVLAVAVYASDMFFYRSGIFNGCPRSYVRVNHALLLTGYTPEAWKLKNSWGRDWGENGYIRVSRDLSQFWCQVTDYGSFPTVEYVHRSEEDENDIFMEQDEVNIAEGKPAQQSTTYDEQLSGPENAVDGKTDSDFYEGSCSRTLRGHENWWKVKYDVGDAIIKRVDIRLRSDCCQNEINGASVHVGFRGDYLDPQCGATLHDSNSEDGVISVHCTGDLKGTYVTIDWYSPYKKLALTICEVSVYAHDEKKNEDCLPGNVKCEDGYCRPASFC